MLWLQRSLKDTEGPIGKRFGQRFDCRDKAELLEVNLALALAREDLAGQVPNFLGDYT